MKFDSADGTSSHHQLVQVPHLGMNKMVPALLQGFTV